MALKKDFITTQEWSREDLDELLKLTKEVKSHRQNYSSSLNSKSFCMLFYNPSTRTRNSCEVAVHELGGHAVFNSLKDTWVGFQSESIKDTAMVLSRYFDSIGIRIFPNIVDWKYKAGNKIMRDYAKHASIPVINFEDDLYHPCQAITDIYTMQEKLGKVENKKIVISWGYHPKPLPMSVANSILLASTRYGMDVTLAHPKGYELDEFILKSANQNIKENGGSFKTSNNINESYKDADIIYLKSWGSLKEYGNIKNEKLIRVPYREEWRLKSEYMALTNKNSVFMHCLPVRRNIVVDDDVIDGPHSIVYDQAENRLHTMKALLLKLLQNNS